MPVWREMARVLGLTDPGGSWYLFWSGVGGDFSELAIIGALVGFYQSRTCDIKGCHRLARYRVRDTEWTVCGRHAPNERPTVEELTQAVPDDQLPDDVPPDAQTS